MGWGGAGIINGEGKRKERMGGGGVCLLGFSSAARRI